MLSRQTRPPGGRRAARPVVSMLRLAVLVAAIFLDSGDAGTGLGPGGDAGQRPGLRLSDRQGRAAGPANPAPASRQA